MASDGNSEINLGPGSHPNGGEEGEREMGELEREIFLQAELYAEEEKDSTETKRKKRMARAALTMWKEQIESSELRTQRGQTEARSIKNEVYNLVGLYSVFEGVVFTAVATSSRLECQHLWGPVGLSLFVYSMLVVVASMKFKEIGVLECHKGINRWFTNVLATRVHILRQEGYAEFEFDRHNPETRPFLDWSIHSWKNALGLIVPLPLFTAGLVFSLVHILCWS